MDKLTKALGYPPKTIAIFRALKLGDLLCSIPAFRALRRAFPGAHIALISLPWAREFVDCYPAYFDEFILFPGWPGLPEQPLKPAQSVAFLQQMQGRQWDIVLQIQGDGTLVNAMLSLFDARLLAGYYRPDLRAERWAINAGAFQPYPIDTHEVVRHVGLMTFLGIVPQGYELEFNVTEADRQQAQTFLAKLGVMSGRFVCIHAGGISGRRWPEDRFAAVADQLAERGYTIVFTGTDSERLIIDTVQAAMTHSALSIAGQTSLRLLGAILQEAALLVSNDTGVAHLAIACQIPSIVIFTSADPAEWGPLNRSRHRVIREDAVDSYWLVLTEATDLLNPNLADITDSSSV